MAILQKLTKLGVLCVFILFLIASVTFLTVGGFTLHSLGSIEYVGNSSLLAWPAAASIVVGVVFLVIAAVGCGSCLMENRVCLMTFFVLLGLALIGQVVVVTLAITYKAKLQENVERSLWNEIRNYDEEANTYYRNELDFIQSVYRCCGVWNLTDWTESNHSIPTSCSPSSSTVQHPNTAVPSSEVLVPWSSINNVAIFHSDAKLSTPASLLYYGQGCLGKLDRQLHEHFVLIVAVGSCFAAVQLCGLISTVLIMWRQKRAQRYETFTDEFGEQI